MTSRDLKRIEDFANRGTRPEPPRFTPELTRFVQGTVNQADESLALLETTLKALGELLEDHPLPMAHIGAMGFSAMELRSQLPALRRAVEEAGE